MPSELSFNAGTKYGRAVESLRTARLFLVFAAHLPDCLGEADRVQRIANLFVSKCKGIDIGCSCIAKEHRCVSGLPPPEDGVR